MVVFADTSFLFTVYGNDAHTPAALSWLRETGQIVCISELADIVRQAKRLSGMYTAEKGHRAFNILHVATAVSRRADRFLTFDANQRKLAEAEGLRVPF